MTSNSETRADSPLWTNPTSGDEPFARLVAPDNLDEVVEQACKAAAPRIAERLKPYQAKIGPEIWTQLLRRGQR